VVIAVKVVGIVLIAAFLVIPAATARLLTRTFRAMTLASIGLGATSVLVGMWASYLADIPSGATIVLVQAVLFATAMLASAAMNRR
jgi:zinc transport system permease protein